MKALYLDIALKSASVLRAGRKAAGYTQRQVAKELGVSAAKITLAEQGLALLNLGEAIRAAELLTFPFESFSMGYIDRKLPAQLLEKYQGNFHFPKNENKQLGSKVRLILRTKQLFSDFLDKEIWNRFLEHRGYDSDYFCDYDHNLPLSLSYELFEMAALRGLFSKGTIQERLQRVWTQGSLSQVLPLAGQNFSMEKAAKKIVETTKHLDCNHIYEAEEVGKSSIAFGVKKRPEIDEALPRDFARPHLCQYLGEMAKNWTEIFLNQKGRMSVVERACVFKGSTRCLFTISI